VEAILNHLTTSRPDEDFIAFCEALRDTNQGHVVQLYLSKDIANREGLPAISATRSHRETEPSDQLLKLPPNIQKIVRPLADEDGWKIVLINRRSVIMDSIDVSNELIDRLYSYGVVNLSTFEQFQVSEIVVCTYCFPDVTQVSCV
jgi:hypothetical protein